MQQGDSAMLKVSCISSLKWQLNDSMTNRMHSECRHQLRPWDLGESGKEKKRFGKINITPKTVKADESAKKLDHFPYVVREMQNVVTL